MAKQASRSKATEAILIRSAHVVRRVFIAGADGAARVLDGGFVVWFGLFLIPVGVLGLIAAFASWGTAGCLTVRGPGTEICASNVGPLVLAWSAASLLTGVGLVAARRR